MQWNAHTDCTIRTRIIADARVIYAKLQCVKNRKDPMTYKRMNVFMEYTMHGELYDLDVDI